MASINTFECDCGYSLTTAWGPDQGYWYRTYKCNNCKNYIIGKDNGPRRNRVFSLVNGEKVRIKAIGFYNEDAQNGEAYKFNQAYCEVCGSNDLLELEDSDMVDSNRPNEFNYPSKLDCPICKKKLIYKMWGVS